MSRSLSTLGFALAFALVPSALVLADATTRTSLAASIVPLALLGGLPACAAAGAAPWVRAARSRGESAGRGLLVGLLPMLAIAGACYVAVKVSGSITATWMLVLAITLTLVQGVIGGAVGALLHRRAGA